MKPSTREVIQTLKTAKIPAEALAITMTLRVVGGVLHGNHWCRRTNIGYSHQQLRQDCRVDELTKRNTCDCVGDVLTGQGRWNWGWEQLLIGATWDTKTLGPEMDRLSERFETGKGRKPAVSLVGKLQRKNADALRSIAELRTKPLTNPVKVYIDELEDELVKAFNRVQRAAKNGTQREAVLAKVQKELVPSNWTGPLPTVDETPMIVGIAPIVRGANQQIRSVLAAFMLVQTSEMTLLEMPRYVYEYLLRAFTPGTYPWMQMQAAEHPGADVVETLKGVWNPQDDGALRDLHKAIEAAKLLKS